MLFCTSLLLCISTWIGHCYANSGLLFNAAFGKQAEQSSDYNSATTAEKAVDDSTSTGIGVSCASTPHGDTTPWWRVDLGRSFSVAKVLVTNRNDLAYRLHDFTVTVYSDESETSGTTCGTHGGSVGTSATATVTCSNPILGRYVKITKPYTLSNDILTMCTVQVMAVRPWSRNCTSPAHFTVQTGKLSSETPFTTIDTDLMGCTKACTITYGCTAFNYNKASSQCRLLNTVINDETEGNPDWELYDFVY